MEPGHIKKMKKKKRKTNVTNEKLSDREPNPVALATTYLQDGTGKKKWKKTKRRNTDTTDISALLEEIIAPYLRNDGRKGKLKTTKSRDDGVNLCSGSGSDTGISVKKKEKKKIHGGELEKPTSPGKNRHVTAEVLSASNHDDSCASTSKESDVSGKPVCKYRPAQIVENTDDFTEEQRKANEYVLAGKYLPTVSECLCNDFGEEERPYIPRFTGDPICPYCHELLKSMKSLDRHVITVHLNIKKFECGWCRKKFAERATLKAHELIHMDATPYLCKYCDRAFRYSSHKCYHMRNKHMKDWSTILDKIEATRLEQKKALSKMPKKKKVSRKGIFEERLEDEDDLIASIINTQTETINGIKESFA